MASQISWELYRSFLAALNSGSLSGASRALGISQPTVGRHIETLEARAGAVLFTRSQAGLLPTEAAIALRDYAESMENIAAAMERLLTGQGSQIGGTVRVTASEVIGIEVLPAIIGRLRAQHPAIKVELTVTNDIQDLLLREADIAVRMQRPRQEQLVARRVALVEVGLFAHEDYLRRCGTPTDPAALGAHSLIGFDKATAFIREASRFMPGLTREVFSIRADSDVAQLSLIRAGAGIGACQAGLARRHPALKRVLAEHYSLTLETWVTMHQDFRNSATHRAAFAALADGLAAYAPIGRTGEGPDGEVGET